MQKLKHLFLILFALLSCRAAIASIPTTVSTKFNSTTTPTTCWNPTIPYPIRAAKLMTSSTHFITTSAAM